MNRTELIIGILNKLNEHNLSDFQINAFLNTVLKLTNDELQYLFDNYSTYYENFMRS